MGREDAAPPEDGAPQPVQTKADKVDILFTIDNSSSMGDKQDLLAEAIPDFLARLISPDCVLDDNKTQVVARTADGACPKGSSEEFTPVVDMHVGVITSALGGGAAPSNARHMKSFRTRSPRSTSSADITTITDG